MVAMMIRMMVFVVVDDDYVGILVIKAISKQHQ
jgi:hypothetical protein